MPVPGDKRRLVTNKRCLFYLHTIAPSLAKCPDPGLARLGVLPSCFHPLLLTVALDQVLKLPLPHGIVEIGSDLQALHHGLLHLFFDSSPISVTLVLTVHKAKAPSTSLF